MSSSGTTEQLLKRFHRTLEACERCPKMIGPVVHGPPVNSPILLVGQAPGPREGSFGRPFAWTAGKTLFAWFHQAIAASEDDVRARVYFAAVARCFPGKAPGGGDRRPDPVEIDNCQSHLRREVELLKPRLVIPVGTLAIEQVMGHDGPLREVVGTTQRLRYHGADMEALPLPHPSGASTWHRTEPGKTLLHRALKVLATHPVVREAFAVQA